MIQQQQQQQQQQQKYSGSRKTGISEQTGRKLLQRRLKTLLKYVLETIRVL